MKKLIVNRTDLIAVLDYLADEEKDFKENGKPRNHIYQAIRKLQRIVKEEGK